MSERVARIRMELRYSSPKIWRRVEVPVDFTLGDLHDVMQAAFDWDGDHLWGFHLGKGDLDKFPLVGNMGWGPDEADEVQLQTLINRSVKKFKYIYDYGDGWEHLITVMRVLDAVPGTKYPNLVAGANCAPIEDIGGMWGFYEFAEASQNPSHPRRAEFEEWLGEEAMNEFDLERCDKELIERRFKKFW